MRKIMAIVTGFMLAGIFPPVSGYAESDDSFSLPTVEIVETLPPEKEMVRTTPANTYIIPKETIEQSNASTLSELLFEQGFSVLRSATADGSDFLVMRGFRSDHLGKELDGRTLILINGRRSGTSNPALIPVLNIERIEVLRGPDMLRYSAAAAGGVINIITQKATPEKPFTARLYGGGGSFDSWRTGVATTGLVNGFDFSLAYSFSKTGDYKTPRGKKVHHSSTDGLTTVLANVGYTFLDKHRLGVNVFFYDVDKAYKPAFTDEFGVLETAKYSEKRNQFFDFTYDGATDDDMFSWNAGYSFGKNISESFNATIDPANTPPFANYYDTRTAYASATYHGDIAELTIGGDYLRYDTDVGNNTFNRQDSSIFYNKALYAIGKLRLFDDSLILSAGARYDYYRIEDNAPKRTQSTTDKTVFKNISPSAGIAYFPTNWLKLRANYTHGFRAPSGRELLEDNMYNYWGNPNLKAEYSDTYEVGADVKFEHANASLTYFFSKTFNYIYQHADPYYNSRTDVERHMRVQNADRQYRSGIEAQGSIDIAGLMGWKEFEIRPMGSLTYMNKCEELYRKNGPDGYTDLTTVPKYSAMGGITLKHKPSDFTVNMNVTHVGQVLRTATKDQGHYTVTNMSAEKRIFKTDDYGELKARLELNNMFNESYFSVNSDYYMPGRSFYLGVIYNY